MTAVRGGTPSPIRRRFYRAVRFNEAIALLRLGAHVGLGVPDVTKVARGPA